MKIRWVIDEAMILLDSLVKVLGGKAKRNDEVNAVSRELRARAVLKGNEVDDVFRNFAGINMQMQRMESAYTGKESKLNETKLFEETVELYRKDPSEFHRKLNEYRAELPVKEIFTRYAALLKKKYAETGYIPGGRLEADTFKDAWKDEWGEELTDAPEKIDRILKYVGTTRGGRIYPRDEEAEAILEEIVNEILVVLRSGVSGVGAEEVFKKFKSECEKNLRIYNFVELVEPLVKKAEKRFFITSKQGRKYFVLKPDGYPMPKDDVVSAMKNSYEPRTFEEIREELWYIPEIRIRRALKKAIVHTGNGRFFYAPNLPIDEEDLARLASRISEELEVEDPPLMTDVELHKLIQDEFPSVATDTESFGVYGLRQCMKYFLGDEFLFEGSVILKKEVENVTLAEMWSKFARTEEARSLENVIALAKRITNGNIYWEFLLNEMVRVSETLFVRRDRINFDVQAIDEILEKMCPNSYAPIKNVNLFILFPEIGGWPWNEFVLESYLYKGSEKFSLIHASFGREKVCGAIVRKNFGISSYEQLVVQVLADSKVTDSDGAALDYLVKNGYQERHRYSDITEIRRKAALLREQRERENSHV